MKKWEKWDKEIKIKIIRKEEGVKIEKREYGGWVVKVDGETKCIIEKCDIRNTMNKKKTDKMKLLILKSNDGTQMFSVLCKDKSIIKPCITYCPYKMSIIFEALVYRVYREKGRKTNEIKEKDKTHTEIPYWANLWGE